MLSSREEYGDRTWRKERQTKYQAHLIHLPKNQRIVKETMFHLRPAQLTMASNEIVSAAGEERKPMGRKKAEKKTELIFMPDSCISKLLLDLAPIYLHCVVPRRPSQC